MSINEFTYEKQIENYGFLNISSSPIRGKIGNIEYNAKKIIECVSDEYEKGANILLLPELALSSYTCGDLFLSNSLLSKIEKAIDDILKSTKDKDILFVFGSPILNNNKAYNCAVVCFKGEVLAIIPKTNISNTNEYEMKYFHLANEDINYINFLNKKTPFTNKILFQNTKYKNEIIGVVLSNDLSMNESLCSMHIKNGATIILNLASDSETVYSFNNKETLMKAASLKNKCAYIYSSSSTNESTTDELYSGSCYIYENGIMLNKNELFSNESILSTIDLDLIMNQRNTKEFELLSNKTHLIIPFSSATNGRIYRNYEKEPFLEKDINKKKEIYEKIINMQALGLCNRLKSIKLEKVILGLSGGLDSTLAFLVCIKAMDYLNLPHKNVIAITLPCFGTSKRTKRNAKILANAYNTSFLEISIKKSVMQHLKDINHDINEKNTTFENAQARERTQVLMDYANKVNGLVIGTGDLSELALGWCTYNGDQMSNYSVNGSIPKTLIRDIIKEISKDSPAKTALLDILNTPVSPELLPPNIDGKIAQLTEEVVGPYILHDFFIYHFLTNKFDVKKIYKIAILTFKDIFDEETIKKWLKFFIKRFFSQQFKRNCMPDGIKVTDISLSPRGGYIMPSDADSSSFLNELE